MTNENELTAPDADDIEIAQAPGNAGNQKHPSQDVLGILPSADGREEPPGKVLVEGEEEFKKWAPRGVRSQSVAHAEVGIQHENVVLMSAIIRGPMMKVIQKAGHVRTMFKSEARPTTLIEFGIIGLTIGAELFIFFLLFTTLDA